MLAWLISFLFLFSQSGREVSEALSADLIRCTGAAASPASGLMAAVRGTFVAIIDLVAAAESAEVTVLGSTVRGDVAEDSDLVLSRQNAKFDVLHLAFDAVTGRNLAVAGLRTVQVSYAGLCTSA